MKRFSVLLFLGACGTAEDTGDSVVAEACLHMGSGPYADVTATETEAGAPEAMIPHKAVRVALVPNPEAEGENIGYVTIAADEATDYLLFTSVDAPLELTDGDGAAVDFEASEAVDACTAVSQQHTVEMGVGTYTLRIGATAETTVTLVIEEAAHEGEEH